MYRLLHRDPKNRLGSREGANEIKRHPFFRGVNWALVRCMVKSQTLLLHEVWIISPIWISIIWSNLIGTPFSKRGTIDSRRVEWKKPFSKIGWEETFSPSNILDIMHMIIWHCWGGVLMIDFWLNLILIVTVVFPKNKLICKFRQPWSIIQFCLQVWLGEMSSSI